MCITVLFGGWWACEEGTWVVKWSRSQKAVLVDESIDYVSLKKQLMAKFNVDGRRHDVELTYVKPKKEGCRPFSIGDDEDLQAYKFVNGLSGERFWPIDLHVSLIRKVGGDFTTTEGSTTAHPLGGGPHLTLEDHPQLQTKTLLAGDEELEVVVAQGVDRAGGGVQFETKSVQLESSLVQLDNPRVQLEPSDALYNAVAYDRGKQVISVSSDVEDVVSPWDHDAERAVREVEEAYQRGKGKTGAFPTTVKLEPIEWARPANGKFKLQKRRRT